MAQHSGLLCLDFDSLGNELAEARRRLAKDNHVLAIFVSPSGVGLKALVPVTATTAAAHCACFKAAEDHFKVLDLVPDPACKDVARLCFASSDSECWIAVGGRKVTPFASPLLSSPEPIPLRAMPTLYTTDAGDERVLVARARADANLYFAKIEVTAPSLVGLYRQILADRAELGLHQRNNWLCKATPFLFRAFSPIVGAELAMLHFRAYSALYSGNEAEHRASLNALWAGLEEKYPSELSPVELGIYKYLAAPERSAFRICRDLALRKGDRQFYMPCDHLALRLAPRGEVNGWRLLAAFQELRIVELVEKGRAWAKGQRPLANIYHWALPLLVSNATTAGP
jgi:hypothetical protein